MKEGNKILRNTRLAYEMYNMTIGEYIEYSPNLYTGNDDSFIKGDLIDILRVPGGWIFDKVFIPYHNEFQEFGEQDFEKMMRLKCDKCGCIFMISIKPFYKYNSNIYKCPECYHEIKYHYNEE